MSKLQEYIELLKAEYDLDQFLLDNSNLPGPRGNLELANAVMLAGDKPLFFRYLEFTADIAPANSPYEFLSFCGTLGLGKLYCEGDKQVISLLHQNASDPRWRTREAVAMALQYMGKHNMGELVDLMTVWAADRPYVQRAVAAGLCEPVLLRDKVIVSRVLYILNDITLSLLDHKNNRADDFIALRKGLGYCWSVAIAAHPDAGKSLFEKLLAIDNSDIRWIIKENLKKNRLVKIDNSWVNSLLSKINNGY